MAAATASLKDCLVKNETKCIASASGKVLIIGGYAVLDQPNPGLVIAVSSSFHVSISSTDKKSLSDDDNNNDDTILIEMISPQLSQHNFYRATLQRSKEPGVDGDDLGNARIQIIPEKGYENQPKNNYVEETISITLSYIQAKEKVRDITKIGKMVTIRLEADNDFYSQQARLKQMNVPLTRKSLMQLDEFLPCADPKNIAKTGLGSSAAMIVSLTGALMQYFSGILNLATPTLDNIHRLAQLSHSVVQGKIGSGFDVCAATFGSLTYVRYDPAVLKEVMSSSTSAVGSQITKCIEHGKWDYNMDIFSLPKGMTLICGDICGGSETPSMSRQILQWKTSSEEAKSTWNTLIKHNQQVIDMFKEIKSMTEDEYSKEFEICKSTKASEWDNSFKIKKLSDLFQIVRADLRKMGDGAKVPVEPEVQTKLCNGTIENCNGVITCGVPGAGGYDAVYAIVLGKESKEQVELYWEGYGGVVPLLLEQSSTGMRIETIVEEEISSESKKSKY